MFRFLKRNQEPIERSKDRLDSWKEIAAYLKRHPRTVHRWEQTEDLPVHRHLHEQRPTVYAYRSELDAWWNNRGDRLEDIERATQSQLKRRLLVFGAIATSLLGLGVLLWWVQQGDLFPPSYALDFQERDQILITNFENRTGEPLLEGTLEYALQRELSDSRYVSVLSRFRVEDALRLMRKPPDTRLDRAVGREVALRDGGVRAMVTGRVEKLDDQYLLSIELVHPLEGTTILSRTERAEGQSGLLPAIRSLSSWLRATLGEGLPRLGRSRQRLLKATTPSLRALQLFSQADAFERRGKYDVAAELLKRAVAIDPEFAAAHTWLGIALQFTRQPFEEWMEHLQKGFDLVGRAGEWESYHIRGVYLYNTGRWEESIPVWEALIERYPDDFWGYQWLTILYQKAGESERAASLNLRRAELRPLDYMAIFQAGYTAYQSIGDLAKASELYARALSLTLPEDREDNPATARWLEFFPFHVAWVEGDLPEAVTELERLVPAAWGLPGKAHDDLAYYIGVSEEALGRLNDAEQAIHQIREGGDYPISKLKPNGLVTIAFLRGDLEGIRDAVHHYLENPHSIGCLVPMIMARTGFLPQVEEEISRIEQDEEANPNEDALTLARGELALAQGRKADAIELLLEGVKQLSSRRIPVTSSGVPEYFLAVESLALTFEEQGKVARAIQVLEEAAREKSRTYSSGGAAFWLRNQAILAALYRRSGRLEEARTVEDELRKHLAYADSNHPILIQLRRSEEN